MTEVQASEVIEILQAIFGCLVFFALIQGVGWMKR